MQQVASFFQELDNRLTKIELSQNQILELFKVGQCSSENNNLIHSLSGLADFLQCSIITAQRLKNSGKIPYKQIGRKIIFNTADVLKAMEAHESRGRRAKA